MPEPTIKAVFLSYASQDAEAAKRICDALRAAGVEVWFDQEGGLEHGDEWDQKIRRQIKECVLFLPLISANTQAREEGYFRIEWELAAERAMGIAAGVAFILPIVTDDTREPEALVPDRFRKVQWTRVPGGVLAPDVLGRLVKLWSHRAGVASHEMDKLDMEPGHSRGAATMAEEAHPATRGGGIASQVSARRYAFMAAAVLLVLGGFGWWVTHRSPAKKPDTAPAAGKSAPLSEAAKLLARAKALYTKLNYTREDLAVAEELARKATELEADSAAAWGARAGVHATYLYRNWDVSEKRRLDTQNAASRALGLNPDEPEALLALGHLLTLQGARPQAEAALRRALAAHPEDNRFVRALGIFLGRSGRVDEERVVLRDALKRDPRDPLVHYDLAMTFANYGTNAAAPADVTAAIEQLDAGIAVQPLGSLLLLKAVLAAGWRGDLPAMRAQLDQLERLPLSERTEDRAVFIAMWGALLERKPGRVVAAGTLTAKSYFEDTVVPRRPKDWALALAHRLDGKDNLARLDWQKAESVLRQRQRDDPNSQTYPVELAATLAWLGRLEEAAREVAPIEAAWREELNPPRARALAWYYGAVGDAAKAAPFLRRALNSGVFTTAPALRLDPWWDKLRGQAEFDALIKEPRK
ncbi:MAG: toll/interleukin-1 receptor domain-containing protein [Verrucomicrobia bacterium]|nr:toll/interleukin-1 receptor domain-containing protein [Verrucomicrobiota bacterium]